MATPLQQPWTSSDKTFLLAEIIKVSGLLPDALLDVIRHHSIEPRWQDILMPPGRNLSSCLAVWNEMLLSMSRQPSQLPVAPGPTTPTSYPQGSIGKRTFGGMDSSFGATGAGREIRPKPASFSSVGYPSRPSPSEPPPKKKRGRPTRLEMQIRAEAQAKAEAEAAAASTYPTNPAMATPQSAIEAATLQAARTAPTLYAQPGPPPDAPQQAALMRGFSLTQVQPAPPAVEETKPQPPTTRLPVSDMLTPSAPPREPPGSHSGSSSGKRRRARSTNKPEPEEPTSAGASTSRSTYESPYGRTEGDPEDTPARTAVMRHRDDHASASRNVPPDERSREQDTDHERR